MSVKSKYIQDVFNEVLDNCLVELNRAVDELESQQKKATRRIYSGEPDPGEEFELRRMINEAGVTQEVLEKLKRAIILKSVEEENDEF